MQHLRQAFDAPRPIFKIAGRAPELPVRLRRLRWQLRMSQAAFAAIYRIDPAMLRAIEAGVEEPDAALEAYLAMVTRAPELVARLWQAQA
ncbi:MAG: helix-turn-helix domain-containing protein [Hyphomonadaceae bacterium]